MRALVRKCAFFIAVPLTVHCGPRVRSQPAQPESGGEPPATVQSTAEAPVASTARDVQGYVISTLVQAGYRCNEDFPTQCLAADDAWQITVSTRVDANATWIGFDSFYPRAARRTCGELRQLVDGLASQADWFTVSCGDAKQELRMSTWVTYGTDLDVVGWMQAHRNSRYGAYKQLEAAGATSR